MEGTNYVWSPRAWHTNTQQTECTVPGLKADLAHCGTALTRVSILTDNQAFIGHKLSPF